MADGGPWLDMSVYPDVDPDSALNADEQVLLQSALSVEVAGPSEAVWAEMMSTALDGDVGASVEDLVDEPTAHGSWYSDGDDVGDHPESDDDLLDYHEHDHVDAFEHDIHPSENSFEPNGEP